jgi:hypothetical protein
MTIIRDRTKALNEIMSILDEFCEQEDVNAILEAAQALSEGAGHDDDEDDPDEPDEAPEEEDEDGDPPGAEDIQCLRLVANG